MWEQVKQRCTGQELPYLSCIYDLLVRYRPKSIVEIGSGLLTAAISAYAPAQFYSLPLSKDSAKITDAILERFGLPSPTDRLVVSPNRTRLTCCKSGHRVEIADGKFDFFLIHKYWTLYGFVDDAFSHLADMGVVVSEQGADLKVRKELEEWQMDKQKEGSLVTRESFLWGRIIAFTRSRTHT